MPLVTRRRRCPGSPRSATFRPASRSSIGSRRRKALAGSVGCRRLWPPLSAFRLNGLPASLAKSRPPSSLTVLSRFGTLHRVSGGTKRLLPRAGEVERSMIKSELIQKVATANPHLFHRDVERIINIVLDQITDALARGDRVELRGFGAFTVKHRAARQGRNPRTGDTVYVEDKYVPFFKTGKELRERLNPDGDR